MRRHFLNPALESAAVVTHGVLSIEEEQVVLAEAQADAVEVEQDLSETERIIEVSDALEDLAVIADSIEEATPAEVALIETAGDMAVAGTDIEAEEVVPSMESFKGGRIATEGLRETATTIWKNIIEFLKKVWAKIEKFFYNMFGTIPSMKSRIQKLRKRIEDSYQLKLENDKKKFNVTNGVASLSVDFAPVKTAAELIKSIETLETAASFVYGANIKNRSDLGTAIAEAISNFDASGNYEAQGEAIATACSNYNSKQTPPGSSTVTERLEGYKISAGAQLLGNVRLVLKDFTGGDQTLLAKLDRFRRTGIELGTSREKGGSTPGDFDFQTMSLADMETVLKKSEGLLETLEDYKRGKESKEVDKAKTKLEQASTKASKGFEKIEGSEADAPERKALPVYKAMINFNAAYARWIQQPAMPFCSHSLTSVSAALTLVQKSLAQYG